MKKQLIILLTLFLCSNLKAQEEGQYLYANVGGGFHNLSYGLKNGNEQGRSGCSFLAGYGFNFNKHWGLKTGIGLQSFNAVATLNYLTVAPSVDADGTAYDYKTNYLNWKEKQQLLFIDLPLGLQYRFHLKDNIQILATAGMKVSIPLKTTYRSIGGEISTKGFYSQYNVELQDLPRHGFNNITDRLTGSVSVRSSYSAFADLGAEYALLDQLSLYAGGYVDYGLNNVAKSAGKLVYQQDGVYNGVMASDQTNSARTIALGLKAGIVWHFGNKNMEAKPVQK